MAQLMGVEFIPCQMTMDMFGIKYEDLIDGMGEPVGRRHVPRLRRRGRQAALHLHPPSPRAASPRRPPRPAAQLEYPS